MTSSRSNDASTRITEGPVNSERIAFLGPVGTYSEQAAVTYAPRAEAISCLNFRSVFQALLSGKVQAAIVPFENALQGHITEVLDLLYEFRNQVHIEHSILLDIRHALGVPNDKKIALENIQEVHSHPQALSQCSHFLESKLPNALRIASESTAQAITLIKGKSASSVTPGVIASVHALQQAGLKVLEADIANSQNNKTRFVVLRAGGISEASLEAPVSNTTPSVTSILVDPGRDRQGLLVELLEIISTKHHVNLLSIHTRPDHRGQFVFHFDLEGHLQEPDVQACLKSLRLYCQHSTGSRAELVVFGSYPLLRFEQPLIESVAIIGGSGGMGQWFQRFFNDAGVEVRIFDRKGSAKLADVVRNASVVLLSIPMSSIESFMRELVPHLTPNTLLVENCSIKNSGLKPLTDLAPSEVEILGIHTMFGPSASSLRGENVILTKVEQSGVLAKAFEDLLYKHGAVITFGTATEHDKFVACVQSLLHLMLIVFGEVLKESFPKPEKLDAFSTPNLRSTMESLQRVAAQSNQLLIDLQTENPSADALRKRFLELLVPLVFALQQGDTKEFLERLNSVREFLKTKADK